MHVYRASRTIRGTPGAVWGAVSDIPHFARNDPFHHNFRFVGPKREGRGTAFSVRHTYAPIFPFFSDLVLCEVTVFKPLKEIVLEEHNMKRRWMNHTQRFILEEGLEPGSTVLLYEIFYKGVSWFLLPLRLWVNWLVEKRMYEKLSELEREVFGG